ncbi:BON domain-containing protein [Paraburkholderia sp. Tr-20389]|uniref:BON domain-containing protein n=1 Tax=Paraburkholderia sp. Tr-20389 TaxID=2703903 RepID=UPI0019811D04|nr:BON domain-containing protein [Paraburkholderia sp. Tr-20389]MBN3754433.1 BON domain-containing protein [Paraburkholderia sp. Tr-20389]
MKLRQFLMSSGLAAVVAFSCTHVFAADAAASATGAVATTGTQAGATKKSIRTANRAFSKTVQKTITKTKGLEDTSITAFGNAKTGAVTLAGQVTSEDQDRLAVDTAKQVHGVTSVTSKLTLRQQGGG